MIDHMELSYTNAPLRGRLVGVFFFFFLLLPFIIYLTTEIWDEEWCLGWNVDGCNTCHVHRLVIQRPHSLSHNLLYVQLVTQVSCVFPSPAHPISITLHAFLRCRYVRSQSRIFFVLEGSRVRGFEKMRSHLEVTLF